VQHFLMSVLTIKESLQRELGFKKFSRNRVPHCLSVGEKVAHIEASTEMLRILHKLEENYFEGITTGDESYFQYFNLPIRPQKGLHNHRQMPFRARCRPSGRRKL
jgi:hypothetical protein